VAKELVLKAMALLEFEKLPNSQLAAFEQAGFIQS
jgi:hypothetical protein